MKAAAMLLALSVLLPALPAAAQDDANCVVDMLSVS